jgi:SAM-dependent methyltransferase
MVDEAKLEAFLGKVVTDAGSALSSLLVHIGDRLGLYKALADGKPATPAELAERTGTNERMIREWLSSQAAAGYVTYDPASGTFTLPVEHAAALADESSPALVQGFFQVIAAVYQSVDKAEEAFRTGKGLAWGDHHHGLFEGTERFFRPGYEANLVSAWIPALDGAQAKLEAGADVADVGCGHGASTIILAKAYPNSRFTGFDYHGPSIERARKLAAEEGVADRVTFEVADATSNPGTYDLIAFFDCLHDMADPSGAAEQAFKALKPDGTVLLVEPNANDRLEDNLDPRGVAFYSASALVCTPCSLDAGGPALGAQAGEARLRDVVTGAGFTKFRRATETPFNMVLEAKA